MRLQTIIAYCAAAIAAGALALGVSMTSASDAAATLSAVTSSQTTAGYLVQLKNGFIDIYSEDTCETQQISDIDPDTLPASEQQRLAAGVHVADRDELLKLLENYSS